MEWSSDLIYSLLEKVRPQEALWNVRNPHYSKKTFKRAIWNDICSGLKAEHPESTPHLTTDAVMAKFTYLRGNFQKLLRTIEKIPSGSGGQTTPKWEFFGACAFLRPVYATSQSEPSFVIPTESVFEGNKEDLEFMCTPLPQDDDDDTLPYVNPSPTPSSANSPSPTPNPLTFRPSASASSSSLSAPACIPSPSSSMSSHCPSPSPRRKKMKIDEFSQVQTLLVDSITTMKDVLKEKRMEKAANTEETFAMTTVKGVMAAIPDSHYHLRVEFNSKLLDLVSETYKKYFNDIAK
ncbi:hypothetical protein Pmani_014870 [Petrolisthes manimaculis]|uniref:MADF domain-containing protein n=1 Tax=Petrolisthes manimaculis TaxID=1843537 RepID=A0AAE1PTD8_9EUCA|nr:hypothetical protein Pmani_014870 [Petrolisthes manimaculis]